MKNFNELGVTPPEKTEVIRFQFGTNELTLEYKVSKNIPLMSIAQPVVNC